MRSQGLVQFGRRDIRLAKDRAQGSAVELPVVRNDRLCERMIAAQNDVTAVLSPNCKPELLEGSNKVRT
jgi:hypothetical protein